MNIASILSDVRIEQAATLASLQAATNEVRRACGLEDAAPATPALDVRSLNGQIAVAAECLYASVARLRHLVDSQVRPQAVEAAPQRPATVSPGVVMQPLAAGLNSPISVTSQGTATPADVVAGVLDEPVRDDGVMDGTVNQDGSLTPSSVVPQPIQDRMEPLVPQPSSNGKKSNHKKRT